MADAGCMGYFLEIDLGDENDAGRFEGAGEKKTEGGVKKSRKERGIRWWPEKNKGLMWCAEKTDARLCAALHKELFCFCC